MARTELRGGQILDASVSLTADVTGTLPVGNGGTGAVTLTGLVKGNGTSAFTTVTAPSGAVVGDTDTTTLTNKRVTPRHQVSNAPGATPTQAWDTYDQISFTGVNAAITSMSSGITGTPTAGQKGVIRIKDDGTARAITWGSSYRAIGVTLPTTTVISKTVYIGWIYNATDTKYDVVAVAQEA